MDILWVLSFISPYYQLTLQSWWSQSSLNDDQDHPYWYLPNSYKWKRRNNNLLPLRNQVTGKQISERIWQDSIADLLVEARLADWREDANSQVKKVVIHSGKNITWYSFRHTYITMRLSAGVPLPTVAANTDTSMKYIQEHYFHYRADESTEILGKGRKIKPAEESLRWICIT